MDNKVLFTVPLSLYGEVTAYSQTMSKVRCRIFYKYGNRNRTYITDEFAEKLISSLPYAPIKGIYDNSSQDYTDHGTRRSLGRAYGVVPVENNFAWEMHTDKDGVTREYACCDVLLWTAIYQQEALDIVNCGESMELYVDSIDGKWEYINGQKYFVFTEGCFLGLQALGEEFEPCFEGAGFYELDTDKLANRLEQFELLSNAEVGGEEQMNFKLSDNQKYNMIWQLLNTRCNEADGYIIDYGICEVYDNYAIVFKYESGNYERAYYTKDDATDSLSIDKMETCYIVDVNENEKKALEVLHQMNGDTYEKIDENYTSLQDSVNTLTEEKTTLESEKETFSQKIEEQDAAISTLEQEKADVTNELNDVKGNFDAAQSTIQTLTEENKDLTEFKSKILKAEKEAVIEHFSALLDADTIAQFQDKLDEWTKEELEKELSYTLVQSKPSIFSYNQEDPAYVPKDNTTILEGVDGIISRYKK